MAEQRDLLVFLRDILESMSLILDYGQGVSQDEFFLNREKQDAVIRRLEIIGEAVKHVPMDFRAEHNQIPWKEMAGMRDVVIHNYFGVSLDQVWKVITDEIPNVRDDLALIIQELEAGRRT